MTKTTPDSPAIIYQSLLYGIFQRSRAEPYRGFSLAITSINPGEGVSHATRGLANALGEILTQRVAMMELNFLQRKSGSLEEIIHSVDMTEESYIRELKYEAHTNGNGTNGHGTEWQRNLEYRRSCIRRLCSHFDVVLIDCPALKRSGEALSIAAAVDGVIMVVQAGRTTKADIAFAERQIVGVGGKLEGHILNKLSTPFLPRWLSRR